MMIFILDIRNVKKKKNLNTNSMKLYNQWRAETGQWREHIPILPRLLLFRTPTPSPDFTSDCCRAVVLVFIVLCVAL